MDHDLGWHDQRYEDGRLGQRYIEWKYFNFYTPGLAGLISYANPRPGSRDFEPQVFMRLYREGHTRAFVHTVDRAQVRLRGGLSVDFGDAARLEQRADGALRIQGALEGVAWDLLYRPLLPVMHDLRGGELTPLPWGLPLPRLLSQQMSWQVLMPAAHVEGTLTLEEQSRSINASGYVDSNWGRWIPIVPVWSWSQCVFQDEEGRPAALVIGDLRGAQGFGVARLSAQGGGAVFTKGSFTIQHADWAVAEEGVLMPRARYIYAERGEERLEVEARASLNDPFFLPIPRWYLPDFYTVQQVLSYRGEWRRPGGQITPIEGVGFSEHSGLSFRQLPAAARRWRGHWRARRLNAARSARRPAGAP